MLFMHDALTNGNGKQTALTALGWKDDRLDLSTHVAVVTGGGRGIGAATCLELVQQGIRGIAVVDTSAELAAFTGAVNQQLGRDVLHPFQGDVTHDDFRRRVFAEMQQRVGPISVCVPAAGITRDRLAVKVDKESGLADLYSLDDFRKVIEIDLTAPIYWAMQTIASVAESRAKRGLRRWEPSEAVEGCIVLIGSVSSTGNKGQISYATAKAGLGGAQATLATEASFYGVRCAIIHPGYTDTGMVAVLGEEFIARNILPQTQLRRLIQPSEIASAIVFMIRNAAVSGRVWVDAGWHPTA